MCQSSMPCLFGFKLLKATSQTHTRPLKVRSCGVARQQLYMVALTIPSKQNSAPKLIRVAFGSRTDNTFNDWMKLVIKCKLWLLWHQTIQNYLAPTTYCPLTTCILNVYSLRVREPQIGSWQCTWTIFEKVVPVQRMRSMINSYAVHNNLDLTHGTHMHLIML